VLSANLISVQRVILLAFIMFCYNIVFTQGSDVQFPIGTKWTYDYIDYPGRHEARTFLIYDTLIYNNEVLYKLQSNASTDVLLKQFDNKV
jgi:hypothetical protein